MPKGEEGKIDGEVLELLSNVFEKILSNRLPDASERAHNNIIKVVKQNPREIHEALEGYYKIRREWEKEIPKLRSFEGWLELPLSSVELEYADEIEQAVNEERGM